MTSSYMMYYLKIKLSEFSSEKKYKVIDHFMTFKISIFRISKSYQEKLDNQ